MQLEDYEITATLTEESDDGKANSVIESTHEVYDFDKLTEKVAELYRGKKPLCSCDALYIKDNDNIYLIEFKNVISSNVPRKSLRYKAYDSIMTLQCAYDSSLSINDIKHKVTFIFVYNNAAGRPELTHSQSMKQMKNKMYKWAKEPRVILYDLEIYKGVFYKDIYTVDKSEFIDDIWDEIFG